MKLKKTKAGFFHRNMLLLWSLLVSVVILGVCSKSSPRYPMNDWVDVHCFLTLGKGMLNGLVPYVDLYEQKGPVLYFVYAIVALFNQNSFWGQFLLEVLSFTAFLYYSGKIARIYLTDHWSVYIILIGTAFVSCTCLAFSHGGSVEQNCLFIYTYALFCVLKAIEEGRFLKFSEALCNGLFFGIAFWVKYTLIGFYLGLIVFVLIWYWIRQSGVKSILHTALGFLVGFLIITIPVLAYFHAKDALPELFTCYFYNNLFLYPTESEETFLQKVVKGLSTWTTLNTDVTICVILGVSYLLIKAKELPLHIGALCLSFFGLCSTTFLGKNYVYYPMVLCAFTVFGLIGLIRILQHIRIPQTEAFFAQIRKIILPAVCLLVLWIAALYSYNFSPNTYLMSFEKNHMPQYQFADTIAKTHEDPKILNFGFLDGGFYYTTKTVPNCKFFCSFNVDAPGMWETQYSFVQDRLVDFVITRKYTLDQYTYSSKYYQLLDTATLYYEGKEFTYYLYGLKNET